MQMQLIRQGDIMFVPVAATPENRKKRESGIIMQGEVTGHHHRLADLEAAEVFESGWRNDLFVMVGANGVSIVHEEHRAVTLAPNTTYQVSRAREFDYLTDANRMVAD